MKLQDIDHIGILGTGLMGLIIWDSSSPRLQADFFCFRDLPLSGAERGKGVILR